MVENYLQPVAPVALVTLGHEPRDAVLRVVVDLVELSGGVSVTEVARPAAQEPIEVSHDDLDWDLEPRARRDLADALAGVSHGLA